MISTRPMSRKPPRLLRRKRAPMRRLSHNKMRTLKRVRKKTRAQKWTRTIRSVRHDFESLFFLLTLPQDIDIITERKDGTQAPPPTQSKYSDIRNIPQRTTSSDATVKPALKKEEASPASGAELPAVSTSKIDVNVIPIHKGTGKPITQVNIDEGMPPSSPHSHSTYLSSYIC